MKSCINKHFGGICRLYIQGRNISSLLQARPYLEGTYHS
jgi:hypothetical protein